MTWIVFDCPSGMSGDMTLGALVDAGVPLEILRDALATLSLEGWAIRAERVTRSSIAATQVHVDIATAADAAHRHFADIVAVLEAGRLPERARRWAIEVFHQLAEAEAAVHGVTLSDVHFHEVGAVDAIIDIAGACVGLDWLCRQHDVRAMRVSQLVVGRGRTRTDHGTMAVPPPAVLRLIEGVPIQWSSVDGERLTPTGAALLRVFAQPLGATPVRVRTTGYGAGRRDFADAPNVLRLLLVDADGAADADELPQPKPLDRRLLAAAAPGHAHAHAHDHGHSHTHGHHHDHDHGHTHAPSSAPAPQPMPGVQRRRVTTLQTQIDDMNPELYGSIMDRLLLAGALDVFFTPVQMKKSRPGTLLTVVAQPEDAEALATLLLNETTTLGVRIAAEERFELDRRSADLDTKYGRVRVKIAVRPDGKRRIAPEYDSIRFAADAAGVPVGDVYRATLHAAEHAKDL
jgi:uncharacterized protein (TIGR00299 family) protein